MIIFKYRYNKIKIFLLSILFYLGVISRLHGQFAIGSSYPIMLSKSVDFVHERLVTQGPKIFIEYSFLPWKKRIQLSPYLHYTQYTLHSRYFMYSTRVNQLGGGIQADFYPLEINGNCMNPLSNRDGNILKKGLFFRLGAGILLQKLPEPNVLHEPIVTSYTMHPQIQMGIGLDIGLLKWLSITPLTTFSYSSSYKVVSIFPVVYSSFYEHAHWLLLNPSIRLLFHFK